MGELLVDLVAVDRQVWSGQAKIVVAKTVDGEMGILPQHEPVLAVLADGTVRLETLDGKRMVFAVHGGFFSVDRDRVTILAESAEASDEIDVVRAESALERARAAGLDSPEEVAAYHRAETRLRVASTHTR
ncbi:MAG: F0F1 ATP synthase subunit epsilon [Actinobacteria bacterium]|nr:F0F1 ATP synthase subunit epsilon [Actinomycetota bacterium]